MGLEDFNPENPAIHVHRIILASRNPHKTREFAEILGGQYAVRDLTAWPEIPAINETGRTFAENATIKAVHASRYLSDLVVADDSGLEVDALNGAPGVFSARYAGPDASDEENIRKLLLAIARTETGFDHCRARFRCVLALADGGKVLKTFEGSVTGTIVASARGEAGFGYDPVFSPAGYSETFAELPRDVKNRLSHRARAIAKLAEYLVFH